MQVRKQQLELDMEQQTGSKSGIKDLFHGDMEKKCKKAKQLSEEALQMAVKRREAKSK